MMARASVRTLLPLDRFTRIVSYSPMLFNQVFVTDNDLQPVSSCSDPVLQYTWQPRGGGAPGREEIALAIAQAEDMIQSRLKFSPVPRWYADDGITIPRANTNAGMLYGYFGGGGAWVPYDFTVRANNFYFIYGGLEAWSTIDSGVPVTYTDNDGDGYAELATVVVSTLVTDPDEIEIFYPGEGHNPTWEIRPIRVSIALADGSTISSGANPITQGYFPSPLASDAGTATITFERHQAVKPDLLEALNAAGVDGIEDANFLASVGVYRHYNDPSQMATAEWPNGICDAVTQCLVAAQPGCLNPIDRRNSLIRMHAADWDADTQVYNHTCPTWWTTPDRLRLWYRAGYRDLSLSRPMHDMSPQLERAIAFLALSYMDRGWVQCEHLNNLQEHWKADLAQRVSTQSSSSSFQVSRAVLDNPFGTTRAAVFAWRAVQPLLVGEAVLG